MEMNRTLILGVTSKGHKVFLHTNLSNIHLDANDQLQCVDKANWSKLLQIGREAVYEMAETGLLSQFLHEYYKGKATFTFEVEILPPKNTGTHGKRSKTIQDKPVYTHKTF